MVGSIQGFLPAAPWSVLTIQIEISKDIDATHLLRSMFEVLGIHNFDYDVRAGTTVSLAVKKTQLDECSSMIIFSRAVPF